MVKIDSLILIVLKSSSIKAVNLELMSSFFFTHFFLILFLQDDHYLGPSVDIWALGILLYLMVTGGMPFKGTTVAELKNAILDGHFEMPDYLSQSCIDLIVGILKRRPDWRLTLQQVRNSFPFFVLFLFTKFTCSRHLELKRIKSSFEYVIEIEKVDDDNELVEAAYLFSS